MKANEGKQEIISDIKISLSKGECPFEMLYFSAGLQSEFKLDLTRKFNKIRFFSSTITIS